MSGFSSSGSRFSDVTNHVENLLSQPGPLTTYGHQSPPWSSRPMDGHRSNFGGGHVPNSDQSFVDTLPENGGESDRSLSSSVKVMNHNHCSPPSPPPRPKNKPGTSSSLPSALSAPIQSNGVFNIQSQLSNLVTISCDVSTSDDIVLPAPDDSAVRNPEAGDPVRLDVTGGESVGAISADIYGLAELQPAHRSRSSDSLNLESPVRSDGDSTGVVDAILDVSASCDAPTVISSSANVDQPCSSSPVEQLLLHKWHVTDDGPDACLQHLQTASSGCDCVVDGEFASEAASLEPVGSTADDESVENLGDPAPSDAECQMICKPFESYCSDDKFVIFD